MGRCHHWRSSLCMGLRRHSWRSARHAAAGIVSASHAELPTGSGRGFGVAKRTGGGRPVARSARVCHCCTRPRRTRYRCIGGGPHPRGRLCRTALPAFRVSTGVAAAVMMDPACSQTQGKSMDQANSGRRFLVNDSYIPYDVTDVCCESPCGRDWLSCCSSPRPRCNRTSNERSAATSADGGTPLRMLRADRLSYSLAARRGSHGTCALATAQATLSGRASALSCRRFARERTRRSWPRGSMPYQAWRCS